MEAKRSTLTKIFNFNSSFFSRDIYFDAIGSKSAILGNLSKGKEIWIYPFKILQHLRIQVQFLDLTQRFWLEDYSSSFLRKPDVFIIEYSHESFSCTEKLLAPYDKPLTVIWLEIDTTKPMKISFFFLPVLQAMWPGAVGGQYSYWVDSLKAFLISESLKKYNFFVGTPVATNHSFPPAHSPSDTGNSIEIELPKGKSKIPLVIIGGKIERDDLETKFQETFNSLIKIDDENSKTWLEIMNSFPIIETPNFQVNQALIYAFLALENAFIENPDLGLGMVAGHGLSYKSTRPGFAWYFGGDCFFNVLALNSIGRHLRSKQALIFFKKYQRADGKIAHEISQSAGMIPWFDKYPYPFYHADTTPMYLLAIWDYFLSFGDKTFLKKIWNSVKQAYNYCLENSDTKALIENTSAGMAAAELGSLLKQLRIDIYLASLSVKIHSIMQYLAQQMNEPALSQKAAKAYETSKKALKSLFWNKEEQRFNFAVLQNGQTNSELTSWSALPVVLDVLDSEFGEKQVNYLSSRYLSTDWGHRMLSCKSSEYNPVGYNNGAVWPFLTGYCIWAEYKYYRMHSGWQHLFGISQIPFHSAPGRFHELYSGEFFHPLEESVPNQMFSAGGLVISFFRGLLGFELDHITHQVAFAPKLPYEWKNLKIQNLTGFDLTIQRRKDHYSLTLIASIPSEWYFNFAIPLPIFSEIKEVRVESTESNPKPDIDYKEAVINGYTILKGSVSFTKSISLTVVHTPGIEIILPSQALSYGQRSQALKLIRVEKVPNAAKKILKLFLEGFPNVYDLLFESPWQIKKVSCGNITSKDSEKIILTVNFDDSSEISHSFSNKVIKVEFD
ncbi:MAG: amylo-alpha-1,6-glucosidase [Candidatus Hermodarchaeota archaeon]